MVSNHGRRCLPRSASFKFTIVVTALYMLTELVVGYKFNALTLQVDAFHMLNDIVTWIIALYGEKLAYFDENDEEENSNNKYDASLRFTYGLLRAQYLSNLINATMLMALCLTLTLESLQKFYSPESLGSPLLVSIVGGAGFVWNIFLGLMVNYTRTPSEEQTQSVAKAVHVEHSLPHPRIIRNQIAKSAQSFNPTLWIERSIGPSKYIKHPRQIIKSYKAKRKAHHDEHHRSHPESDDSHEGDRRFEGPGFRERRQHDHHDDSTTMLLIHIFGDVLGNLAVVADGFISYYYGKNGKRSHWDGIGIVDPLCSLVIVCALLYHTLPMVASTSFVLMQGSWPKDTGDLRNYLIKHVHCLVDEGVEDLRMWSLSSSVSVGSVRLIVDLKDVNHLATIVAQAKRGFEECGVPKQFSSVEVVDKSARVNAFDVKGRGADRDIRREQPPSYTKTPSRLHALRAGHALG
ncbi:cation efflux protein [Meredithblackwellia eburnea MCA 4105]